ncbi:hypothetical protein H4W32_004766 [Actinophytocola algeriensis]|nr:hypothetical protein [Actinophytocola algeriensis]
MTGTALVMKGSFITSSVAKGSFITFSATKGSFITPVVTKGPFVASQLSRKPLSGQGQRSGRNLAQDVVAAIRWTEVSGAA